MKSQRDLSNLQVPWWGFLILWLLTGGGAIFLWYTNPVAFPLNRSIPATLVYFGLFWLIVCRGLPWLARRFSDSEGSLSQSLEATELFFAVLLMCIGFLAGTGAGAAWWLAGGWAATGFGTAVLGGGIIGGVVPLALLAGG